MKALGRSIGVALAIATCAFAISATSAYAGSMQVNVKGVLLTTGFHLAGTAAKSKLLVPSQPELEIACTSNTLTISAENVGTEEVKGTAEIIFSGCTFPNTPNCTIYPTKTDLTNKTNTGKILAEAEGHIALGASKSLFIVAEGLGFFNTRLTTIFVGQFNGCTIPEKTEVKGKTAMKIPNGAGQATTQAVNHTKEDATLAEDTALGLTLKIGANLADFDAATSTDLHLTGLHSGQTYALEP